MRGVKRGQESTGGRRKDRYREEFKVATVKIANGPDVETKTVASRKLHKPGIDLA